MPTDLHLALQRHYADANGLVEAPVEGYLVDVLRDDVVYEIQTRGFGAIRAKLIALAQSHQVVLVHPIPATRFIVRISPETGEVLSSRRSPKRWQFTDLFWELPHITGALREDALSVEVVWTVQRELRCDNGKGSWRNKGVSVIGRELVEIVGAHRYCKPTDFLSLLPDELPHEFTTADLAATTGIRRNLAGRMAYTLRHIGAITLVGKRGNALVYERNDTA